MIGLALALTLILAPGQPSGEHRATMTSRDALALFERVCSRPFPDPDGFARSLAAETQGFRKKALPFPAPPGPNGRYLGADAEVVYSAADGIGAALPSRLCGVLLRTDAPVDHPALASAMEGQLSLTAGRTQEREGRFSTEWTAPDGEAVRRHLLISRPDKGGTLLSLAMMRRDRR